MRTVVALSLAAVAQASVGTVHTPAPLLASADPANVIPGSYLIKFKDHVDESAADSHHVWLQQIHDAGEQQRLELRKRSILDSLDDMFAGLKHTYNIGETFRGYSGHFHDDVIDQVRRHPDVEYVEHDSMVHTMVPIETETSDSCEHDTQTGAPWGLARISHREPLSFSSYNKFLYTHDAGEGVDIYVIDTGINIAHVEFEGRAKWGATIPSGDSDEDGNGHGTHCAGTIASRKYGVTKKSSVYAVKVLRSNGSGTMSDVIGGVEYAVKAHKEQVSMAKSGKRKGYKGSVANMSLGGGKTNALDAAVNAAVAAGIHFAVAAGNDNADACGYSPAAASNPVTVGASTLGDERAYFSNTGACVDIFAPGLNILSTWTGSKTATKNISGTSMASPHTAGLLAYFLSIQPSPDSEFAAPALTPKKLKEILISIGTKGALSDIDRETPNVLIYNGGGCGNFSDIVKGGSYTVKHRPATIEELEAAIENDFEIVSGEIVKGAKKFGAKADKFAKKIHALVEEEIEEFLAEVSE